MLFLFGSISFVQAQLITVTGTVSDPSGNSLPGANVKIKGETKGVTTGFDGSYTIKANSNDVLTFSFLGLRTRDVAINGKTSINITLNDNSEKLKEIVVIGYGSQKKEKILMVLFQP